MPISSRDILADTVELSRSQSTSEGTSTGDNDDDSTQEGGVDILQQLLNELSLSFDTTKSGGEGYSFDTEEEETELDETSAAEEEEETSSETEEEEVSETEMEDTEPEEATELEETEQEGNEQRGHEPEETEVGEMEQDVSDPLVMVFSDISSVQIGPEIIRPPQCGGAQRMEKVEEEPTARETIPEQVTQRGTVAKPQSQKTSSSSSSYMPSILNNLWRCTNEKDLENVDDDNEPALEQQESHGSVTAPSDEEKSVVEAKATHDNTSQAVEQQPSAGSTTNASESEHTLATNNSTGSSAINETIEYLRLLSVKKRTSPKGLSKTYSMPVYDFNDEHLGSAAIRAVRSHEIERHVSKNQKQTAAEQWPEDEQCEDIATTKSGTADKEEDGDTDPSVPTATTPKCHKSKKDSHSPAVRLRRFSSAASNQMIESVRSSTSWANPSSSTKNLRQVKSLENYAQHNSILLPDNRDFCVTGLADQKEDGDAIVPTAEEESLDQVEEDQPDTAKKTATATLDVTETGSRKAPNHMLRLRKKITGLAKGKKDSLSKETTSLVFSADQRVRAKKLKRKRSKRNIFRSLAKYVKSRPLGLSVISENPDEEIFETEETVAAQEAQELANESEEEDNEIAETYVERSNVPSFAEDKSRDIVAVVESGDGGSHDEDIDSVADSDIDSQSESEPNFEDESTTMDEATSLSEDGDVEESAEMPQESLKSTSVEVEEEVGTELALAMPNSCASTEIEDGALDGNQVLPVDIHALNEANNDAQEGNQRSRGTGEMGRVSYDTRDLAARKGKKNGLKIKALLTDFKKMAMRKSGDRKKAGATILSTVIEEGEEGFCITLKASRSSAEILQPTVADAEDRADNNVDIERAQMNTCVEDEQQKSSTFSSILASPSSPRSSKLHIFDLLEKRPTWTGSRTRSPAPSEVKRKKSERKIELAVETTCEDLSSPPLSTPAVPCIDDGRDDTSCGAQSFNQRTSLERTAAESPPVTDKVHPRGRGFQHPSLERTAPESPLATDNVCPRGHGLLSTTHHPTLEGTAPKSPLATDIVSPRGRGFLSRTPLVKYPRKTSAAATKENHQAPTSEEVEYTLTSFDKDRPRLPPAAPNVALDLQRWRSLDEKIDASLKKAEALASHYGKDLADMLYQESASSASSQGTSVSAATSAAATSAVSAATSAVSAATSMSEVISVAESKSSDWGNVGRKIDDSLSKIEMLANRLGRSKKQNMYSE